MSDEEEPEEIDDPEEIEPDVMEEPDALTFVESEVLVEALRRRGVSCVIGLVKIDGNVGSDNLQLGLYHGGDLETALWSAINLVERIIVHCEDAGMPPSVVERILSNIVYKREMDEEAMPERPENPDPDDAE